MISRRSILALLALVGLTGPAVAQAESEQGLPTIEVVPTAPAAPSAPDLPSAPPTSPARGAPPEPRFTWMVWPLLQPGPLFTPDWWKGTWGGQLTLYNVKLARSRSTIEIDVAEALGGVLVSSITAAGPAFAVRGAPVLDTIVKASGTVVSDERWQLYARVEALIPTDGARGSGEASIGVAWKQDRSEVPWEGPVVAAVATGGVQPGIAYGFGESVASWYLPAAPGGAIVVPTVIVASILGSPERYPPDRLLSVANGASLQTRELLVTTIDPSVLRASFLGASTSVRFPIMTFPIKAPNGMAVALYGSFNAWGAMENLVQRPPWMEAVSDGGLSAALALVPVTGSRPAGSPFVLKLGARFVELAHPLEWRVDLLFSTGVFPTGPQAGIDWYW